MPGEGSWQGAEKNRLLQWSTTSFAKKSWKDAGSCSPSGESSCREAPELSLQWINYSINVPGHHSLALVTPEFVNFY